MRAVFVILVASAALAGCGKAELSAADLAARLAKPGAVDISDQGFRTTKDFACAKPGSGDAWAARCRAVYSDAARGGGLAGVEVQLFDKDVDFKALDASIAQKVENTDHQWLVSTTPTFTIKDKKTGQSRTPPTGCHQALGPQGDGPAICAFEYSPRIVVIAVVQPIVPASQSMVIRTDGNSKGDESLRDVDHANDLALAALAHVSALR
jgi:hypothetical protein